MTDITYTTNISNDLAMDMSNMSINKRLIQTINGKSYSTDKFYEAIQQISKNESDKLNESRKQHNKNDMNKMDLSE